MSDPQAPSPPAAAKEGEAPSNSLEAPAPTRVEQLLTTVKNHPVFAVAIFIGIVIIATAKLGEAVTSIETFLFGKRQTTAPQAIAMPDLVLCRIDLSTARVDICNQGPAVARARLSIAYSPPNYTKKRWNTVATVSNIGDTISINPGEKIIIDFISPGKVGRGRLLYDRSGRPSQRGG